MNQQTGSQNRLSGGYKRLTGSYKRLTGAYEKPELPPKSEEELKQEMAFTETFYGQLVTNLDDMFERSFMAEIDELTNKPPQPKATPQIDFNDATLRMLFADVAAVYVEPAKEFILKLESNNTTLDGRVASTALLDIARASEYLELKELNEKIRQIAGKIRGWERIISPTERESVKEEILREYAELEEMLPQTFRIQQQRRASVPALTPAPAGQGPRMTVKIAALRSNLIVYHYPPRLHPHIDIVEQEEKGKPIYWFKDTRSERYFKAGKREHDIILLLNGKHTLVEIRQFIKEQMNIDIKLVTLAQIIAKLDAIGLIDGVQDPKLQQKKGTDEDLLGVGAPKKFRVSNPDKFFTVLDKILWWMFTKTFVYSSLLVMMLVMLVVSNQREQFYPYGQEIVKQYGVLFTALSVWLVISIHEIGHGVTCKHYGGRVTDVGFMFFSYIIPAGYCNVSDIYLFKNKWHRIYVMLAGLYTQFLIASVAGIGTQIFEKHTLPSDLSYIFFFGATASTIINFIPLFKLDGYYVLTNALGEYNLQKQALDYVNAILGKIFWGFGEYKGTLTTWQRYFYLTYGLASFVFIRIFPIYFLVLFVTSLLSGYISLFNVILPAIFIVKFYKTLLSYLLLPQQLAYTLIKATLSPATPLNVRLRTGTLTAILTAIVLFVTLYHLPERLRANCQVALLPQMVLPVRTAKEGVVQEVLVKDQELVRAGQVIARLVDSDVALEHAQLEATLASLQRQREGLAPQIALQQSVIAQATVQQQSDQATLTEALATPESIVKQLQLELAKVERMQQECRDLKARYETLAAAAVAPPLQVERLELRCAGLDNRHEQLEHQLQRAQVVARREVSAQITTSTIASSQLVATTERLQKVRASQQAIDKQIATVRTTLAMLATANKQLTIVAPRDGVIVGPHLPQLLGRRIAMGGKICEIGDLQQMQIEIELPEWQHQRLHPGQPLRVIMHSQTEIIIDGWIDKIKSEPILKPTGERIFVGYFSLPQPRANLHAGQSGEAFVTIAHRTLWQRLLSRGERLLFELGVMAN